MSSEQVKALQYDVERSLSVFDHVHGHKTKFTEVYIPEYNITFNEVESNINVFKRLSPGNEIGQPRTELIPVTIDKSVVVELVKIMEVNEIKKHIRSKLSKFLD